MSGSEYYATIFSVTDSVLEDNVNIEAYTYPYGHPGVLDTTQIQVTFANNRGDNNASLTVRDVDARNQIHVRVTGNDFPNGSFTYGPHPMVTQVPSYSKAIPSAMSL